MSETVGKCPNSILYSKEKFAWVHTGRLTLSWSCQLAQVCVSIPKRKGINWQPVTSRGEIGRNPKTNSFGSYWNVAKCASLPHRGLHAVILVCSHDWQFYLGKLMKQISWECSLTLGVKEKRSSCCHSKVNKEAGWIARKVYFTSETSNWGAGYVENSELLSKVY